MRWAGVDGGSGLQTLPVEIFPLGDQIDTLDQRSSRQAAPVVSVAPVDPDPATPFGSIAGRNARGFDLAARGPQSMPAARGPAVRLPP